MQWASHCGWFPFLSDSPGLKEQVIQVISGFVDLTPFFFVKLHAEGKSVLLALLLRVISLGLNGHVTLASSAPGGFLE